MKALITGGSSGIGRDMARILAKLNYNLILVARNEDGLTKIKNELETENNKINITIYPMDLNIKENCYKLYENRVSDIFNRFFCRKKHISCILNTVFSEILNWRKIIFGIKNLIKITSAYKQILSYI